MTCHFLQSGPASVQIQSVYLHLTSLQHDSILAVSDSRSIRLQTVSQMLHPAGILHGVPNTSKTRLCGSMQGPALLKVQGFW